MKFSLKIAGTMLGLLALAACSAPDPKKVEEKVSGASEAFASAEARISEASEKVASAVAKADNNKVMSCTEELTFEKAPERILVMGDYALPFLVEMDMLDKVVALAEKIDEGVYDDATYKKIQAIPFIEGQETEGGGAKLSTEAILEVNPDLVIGHDSGAERDALRKAGVPFYSPDAWCPDFKLQAVSFDNINDEIKKYATIFHKEEAGDQLIKKLEGKIDAVKSATPGDRGTGMAIYIDEGAEEFWGYGNASMVNPQFEAVGLKNVYADRTERLIEGMSMEEVLSKNPGTIVLLHQGGTPEGVKRTFENIPGASNLDAVKNGKLYTMPFFYTDPPTPTSVTGVEKLNEILGK